MTVGERIRKARKDSGLTQNQLAARLSISYVNISQLERGERSPSVDTLQKIADALDVPVGELLGTIPQPDREYERVHDALDDANIAIMECGWGDGSGPDGDRYYVWHKDAEVPEDDVAVYSFGELREVVDAVSKAAEEKKREYFRKRLDAELFYRSFSSTGPLVALRSFLSNAEGTDATPAESPQKPPNEGADRAMLGDVQDGTATTGMICPICGQHLVEDVRNGNAYCRHCGLPFPLSK